MNRIDSAFHETFRSVPTNHATKSNRKSETGSGRDRLSGHTVDDLQLNHDKDATSPTTMRPTLLERPNTTSQTSAQQQRRKSMTTTSSNSNSNSTKSRRRGHGSHPSSRRTSCTVIDPSRPTRHYRINSSQTSPSLNRDIDDVLALHFRSCSLFQNPTYQPSLHSPTTASGFGPSVASPEIGDTSTSIAAAAPGPWSRPATSAATHGHQYPYNYYDASSSLGPGPALDEKSGAIAEIVSTGVQEDHHEHDHHSTIMHWMSPSTRKTQYEKIDRANSGLKGLLARLVPRCVAGPAPQRFYEEEKGGDDAGSVRRYRMDVEGVVDHHEEEDEGGEGLKMQRRRLARMGTTRRGEGRKVLGCF